LGKTVSDSTVMNPDAEPAACRRFSLADAMILIAGIALVLSMGGYLLKFFAGYFIQCYSAAVANRAELLENWPRFSRAIREPLRQAVSYGFQFSQDVVLSMTLVFFIVRMRSPRPPWRVLLVQPGMLAALSIFVGLFWVTGFVHILLPDRIDAITGPAIVIGGTVATAWVVLALIRRWKAEPGWVDCIGRLLGVMAIGTALLGLVMYRI
jgi:hypothetical protein